jgi:hypothetical protein
MKVAVVAIALNEERFIKPWLQHIPDWVNDKCVLISEKPWFGDENVYRDKTYEVAEAEGAMVIKRDWKTEEDQRNFAQELFGDYDWLIILDPDEFLDNNNWYQLRKLIESEPQNDAFVVDHQLTYWKDGWVADPPRDYQQLILVRPGIRFIDKRVVNSSYEVAPVFIHHFSWARTDMEVWEKISHYAHANDFDTKKWYADVWKKWQPGDTDVHPTSPDTLHEFIKAELPPELEELNLWPIDLQE